MRVVSGESCRGPLLATAWVCSISNVRCRSVGPTGPRLMRGHILGPAFRCLPGCWAQPSGLLRHAGGSLIYFMVVILKGAPLASWRALAVLWYCLQGAALRGAESSASGCDLVRGAVSSTARRSRRNETNTERLGRHDRWLHPRSAVTAANQITLRCGLVLGSAR
jgi:hypothetical protein